MFISTLLWLQKADNTEFPNPSGDCGSSAPITLSSGGLVFGMDDPVSYKKIRKTFGKIPKTLIERWWLRVEKLQSGSWVWKGKLDKYGYSRFNIHNKLVKRGRQVLAYRWGYEQLVGPVPKGLELDHLCRNRACVNPSHLEAVTHCENTRRGLAAYGGFGAAWNRAKTHCPYGHPYDDKNTYVYRTKGGGFGRACRVCVRDAQKRYEQRKRERLAKRGQQTSP